MILADKIIENRKKNGWSQEELAGMLGVSRQSVSKWESAQAVPDMKKILQLSEVFGVTTDYLIKDEIESVPAVETAPVDSGLEETVRQVSMEEANTFLFSNERAARRISTGVMLCILAPVAVVVLGGLAEAELISMGEAHAEIAGTAMREPLSCSSWSRSLWECLSVRGCAAADMTIWRRLISIRSTVWTGWSRGGGMPMRSSTAGC